MTLLFPSDEGIPVNVVVQMRLPNAYLKIYTPSFKAKDVLDKIEYAKCESIEELLESMVSEKNQDWVDHNWMPGKSHTVSEKAFKFRKSRDKNTNYREAIHTLFFDYNGSKVSITKFWMVDNERRTVLGSLVAQKKGNRWYGTSIPGIDYLSTVIGKIKSKVLLSLITGDSKGDHYIKKFIDKTRTNDHKLDFDKLFSEMQILAREKKWDELFRIRDKNNP